MDQRTRVLAETILERGAAEGDVGLSSAGLVQFYEERRRDGFSHGKERVQVLQSAPRAHELVFVFHGLRPVPQRLVLKLPLQAGLMKMALAEAAVPLHACRVYMRTAETGAWFAPS